MVGVGGVGETRINERVKKKTEGVPNRDREELGGVTKRCGGP